MKNSLQSARLRSNTLRIMPTTLTFCRLNFQKLYAKSRKLGIAEWNDALDYPDFIHGLWLAMRQHPELQEEARKIQDLLNDGDAIELLSAVVIQHRQEALKNG